MNDGMGRHIAHECIKHLLNRNVSERQVAVLGVTFKENVSDVRNSKVVDIVRELMAFGIQVVIADPHADPSVCEHEFDIKLTPLEEIHDASAVILAVPHASYVDGGWKLITGLLRKGEGFLYDVKGVLDRGSRPANIELKRL
jgi:UDP-N-acetyl-D-galactosamine dehydrogenase